LAQCHCRAGAAPRSAERQPLDSSDCAERCSASHSRSVILHSGLRATHAPLKTFARENWFKTYEEEAAEAEAGRSAREFVGEGNRQYLTGLNLGGQRIVILVDTSASMLANQLVNVIRLRNMDAALQKQAGKWVRTLNTVDWLTAQLPVNAQFQVITFGTEAKTALEQTAGQWLEVADTPKLEAISNALREQVPAGGTSLHNAFASLAAFPVPPDNIFLLTDGLPTQGERPPRSNRVSGDERLRLFREAIRQLPSGVPVNTILFPMEGDPMAASEYWQLARASSGSFLSPSTDWP